jgi:hypothetical protein
VIRYCDMCEKVQIGVGDAYHHGQHSHGLRLCPNCYYSITPDNIPSREVLVRTLNKLREENAQMYYGKCPIYPKPKERFYKSYRVRAGYD